MKNRNIAVSNKRALYENIMSKVSKEVKRSLCNINESKGVTSDYDYRENVVVDVIRYLHGEYTDEELRARIEEDKEKFAEELDDVLWTNDGVTGNGSGSYWCNAYKAEEAMAHNYDLFFEACDEFGVDMKTMRDKFSAEYADVTIRCYLLYDAIRAALDTLEDEYMG